MSEAERPDPDALLAQMKREEAKSSRGKLKIFFGMSPGVGKTFAMLQAARQKMLEGCEVVVGMVETHGRKETEALTEGMPIMPRTQVEYRGTTLQEMDLDAILTWHPGLAVVDELAHTNAPDSLHPKRWLAVMPLADSLTLPACPLPAHTMVVAALHGGLLGERGVRNTVRAFLAGHPVRTGSPLQSAADKRACSRTCCRAIGNLAFHVHLPPE